MEKTNEISRGLKNNIDVDDAVRSCEGRTNVYDTARGHVVDKASKSFTAPTTTFSPLHSNPTTETGVLTGVVSLILPPNTYTRRDGTSGFVQIFIVVDTMGRRLNSDVWRYKIVAWDEQAKNLNIETNRVYRFEHFKIKPKRGNGRYLGQDDNEVHLTSRSTITEVSVK